VTLRALADPRVRGLADFLIIGDRFVLERAISRLKLRLRPPLIDLQNVPRKDFSFGKVRPSFGKAAIEYVDKALELLKAGRADGLVTAPVNKSAVQRSGIPDFTGHTEYLAEKTGSKDFAMMLTAGSLRVTLATRHIALKDVPKRLSADSVYKAITLTRRGLKDLFSIRAPRIGVAALNPHAGEGFLMGGEEADVIKPAIRRAGSCRAGVSGPIPADVIFRQALDGKFDAVVAMYHDQGLAPFKTLYFSSGVNLTLGLPFVRTSPDHGTAHEIAPAFAADPTSMIEAIRLTCRLS
jgi:4-hydroxythreonine-4-phosphate dehydrogenase